MKKNANILLMMHRKESKSGITRTSPDGTLSKIFRVIYCIACIYTLFINIIYSISAVMDRDYKIAYIGKDNLSVSQEDQLAAINNSVMLVLALSAVLIAGIVLLLKRKFIPALVINAICCPLLAVHFAERMSETLALNGLLSSYSYNHLIPLFLTFASALLLCIIGICFERSENKAYQSIVNRLFAEYSDKFDKLTDEEWESFLESYQPPQKKVKKKK